MSDLNIDLVQEPFQFTSQTTNYRNSMDNPIIADLLKAHAVERADTDRVIQSIKDCQSPRMKRVFAYRIGEKNSCFGSLSGSLQMTDEEFNSEIKHLSNSVELYYWHALIQVLSIDFAVPPVITLDDGLYRSKKASEMYLGKDADTNVMAFNKENIEGLFNFIEDILNPQKLELLKTEDCFKFKRSKNGDLEISTYALAVGKAPYYPSKDYFKHIAHILLSHTYENWIPSLRDTSVDHERSMAKHGVHVYIIKSSKRFAMTLTKEVADTLEKLLEHKFTTTK